MTDFKYSSAKTYRDDRDYLVKFKSSSVNSTSFDLSQYCSPVRDQGDTNTSTVFACIDLFEMFYNMKNASSVNFSPKFTYFDGRVNISGWFIGNQSSVDPRSVLKSLNHAGTCLESSFPFYRDGETTFRPSDIPSEEAIAEAKSYIVPNYASLSYNMNYVTIESLKKLLENGCPFVGSFQWSNSDLGGASDIQTRMWTNSTLHTVVFVGFDDNKNAFKFKNSFGTAWGENGYGYLSYDCFNNRSVADLWMIYDTVPEFLNICVPNVVLGQLDTTLNNILIQASQGNTIEQVVVYVADNYPDANLRNPLIDFVNELYTRRTVVQREAKNRLQA